MATLSSPFRSPFHSFHFSPLPHLSGPMAVRHQQPHRRRHLLALIDRKGSLPPLAYSLSVFLFSIFLSTSREPVRIFVRDEISLGCSKERKRGRGEEGCKIRRGEEMSRSFHRAAYDAGAFITIRTGELTGDTCGDHP